MLLVYEHFNVGLSPIWLNEQPIINQSSFMMILVDIYVQFLLSREHITYMYMATSGLNFVR